MLQFFRDARRAKRTVDMNYKGRIEEAAKCQKLKTI